MRTRIIAIGITAWMSAANPVQGQSWIGEAFKLDTSMILSYSSLPSDLSHLQHCIHDNIIYFTEQKAFQHAENDYAAHIYAFSLTDLTPFEFNLPLPPDDKRKEWQTGTYWITDFCFHEDQCVVSVQDHIFLYNKLSQSKFEFDTTIDHPNVKSVYLHQGDIYYLEEDHDTGYKWFRFDPKTRKETLVRELPYEAPHVVQASPNRYLFHDENNLYFLSTRYPVLSQYRLDGTWLKDVRLDLPHWHPFEDEYIQNSLRVPYGVERIYATKDHIFKYSYLKMAFPIDGRYLVFFTQYDTCSQKSATMFAIADSTGEASLYLRKCPKDYRFTESRFPFNVLEPLEALVQTGWQDRLVEITVDCDVAWHNLTAEEYHKLKEDWFRQHDPIIKIRIMRFKNKGLVSEAFFYNGRHELTSLDRLPDEKHVVILHNSLECSACAHYLLQAMNSLDTEQVHLDILHAYIPGALQERELHKDVRKYVSRNYDFYYLATDRTTQYPCYISDRVSRYPAVLFYEKGKAPILFSNEQIFDDDPYTYRFRPAFQEVLDKYSAK
ncbi:MAG: hypothetical protein IKZ52_08135 [Bacteroidales bacterium]|nr:hypothetical protein [Bacteroidales bacterium]